MTQEVQPLGAGLLGFKIAVESHGAGGGSDDQAVGSVSPTTGSGGVSEVIVINGGTLVLNYPTGSAMSGNGLINGIMPRVMIGGIDFAEEFGPHAFIMRARTEGVRDFGCCMAPQTAFYLLQGLETLPLRMARRDVPDFVREDRGKLGLAGH